MRIHRFELENFRAINHLKLTDIPDRGVLVIYGDNEQGKSSVLEAIRIVLSENHRTSKQAIRSIQPVDRDVPIRISLEFSIGPYHLAIRKQFLKAKSAELRVISPKSANFTGEEAEKQLSAILDQYLDRFLLDTLFMIQGDVDAAINAVGIPSLTAALNADNGTDDSTDDTELMTAVDAEYFKYFTKTGKRSKRFEQFFSAVEELKAERDDAQSAALTLRDHVDRVARLELDCDLATQQLPTAEEELAAQKVAVEAAKKLKSQVQEIDKRLSRVQSDVQLSEKAVAQRSELRSRVDNAEKAVATAQSKLEFVHAAATAEEQQLSQRTLLLNNAKQAEKEAADGLKISRNELAFLQRRARRAQVAEILGSVAKIDEQIHQLRIAQANGDSLSADNIEELVQANDELRVLRALAQSRGGSILLSSEDSTEVLIDEKRCAIGTTTETVDLDHEVTIVVAGVTIVITPGSMISNNRAELEVAQRRILDIHDQLGVDSLADLRSRFDIQQKRIAEISTLLNQRAIFGSDTEIAELRAEYDAAQDVDSGMESPKTIEQAQLDLHQAEETREEAFRALNTANAALDGLREQPAARELTVLTTQLVSLRENLAQCQTDVEISTEEASDSELTATLAKRKQESVALELEKADIDALIEATEPELVEQLFLAAEANVQSFSDIISTSTTELARLEGHIDVAGGATERLSRADAALLAAENRLDSEQRRAMAAKHLREVLNRHRENSRKRYAAPFASSLSRYAARVFGQQTNFGLDDSLSIKNRSIGSRTVDVDFLSGGAQEQLAILSRFAIAELVATSSADNIVPVFIDDALGSTDKDRLMRISTVFGEVGKHTQVFVLTCVPERFNYVASKTMRSIDDLKNPHS